EEIAGSQARIGEETGEAVTTFAYPNGLADDFSPAVREMLRERGFQAAFTLLPGPSRASEARRDPLAIRRVSVYLVDHPSRFVAKVMGFIRLTGRLR
ncbi:MAG: polysaccharide deacetylase family protein, partial [Acidimicrobiia bacterium]